MPSVTNKKKKRENGFSIQNVGMTYSICLQTTNYILFGYLKFVGKSRILAVMHAHTARSSGGRSELNSSQEAYRKAGGGALRRQLSIETYPHAFIFSNSCQLFTQTDGGSDSSFLIRQMPGTYAKL